jgi:ATP-binding cassette subfamily C protein CydD
VSLALWLRRQSPLAGGWLRLAVALGAVGGLLLVAQAWLVARTIDAVLFQGAGLPEVQTWMWTLAGIFTARAVLTWASEQAAVRAAAGVKLHLRRRLFEHLRNLGPLRLAKERSGDLAVALTDGVEALEAYYARYLPATALAALVPLAVLVFMLAADWLAGLLILLTAPLIPLFMVLIGKGAERLNQRQWRRLARLSARFLDAVQGLTTLKLFNASRREADLVARAADDYRRSTLSVLRVAFLSSLALEFFATVGVAAVAVTVGFRLLWGEMSFLHGLFVLLLAPEAYLPLRTLGTHYHARMAAIGAAERMVQILETPLPPRPEHPLAPPCPRGKAIRLRHVHFAYEPGRGALYGLDLEIWPGERLAVVGPSGAGKSTLVSLLLGFARPDSGEILVGDTPLAAVDPDDWRRHLAWIPQRPRIFHGTLLDNIRLGIPDAPLDAVRLAARRAGAAPFIETLPAGYATRVGEGGLGLSGGQAQRLALARAFLRDAPLLILDEPTASLDPESEALVQQGIEELARDRTVLTVAHRLHTVLAADRILVLDRGRVVQDGTHRTLVAADGPYRRLALAYGIAT